MFDQFIWKWLPYLALRSVQCAELEFELGSCKKNTVPAEVTEKGNFQKTTRLPEEDASLSWLAQTNNVVHAVLLVTSDDGSFNVCFMKIVDNAGVCFFTLVDKIRCFLPWNYMCIINANARNISEKIFFFTINNLNNYVIYELHGNSSFYATFFSPLNQVLLRNADLT